MTSLLATQKRIEDFSKMSETDNSLDISGNLLGSLFFLSQLKRIMGKILNLVQFGYSLGACLALCYLRHARPPVLKTLKHSQNSCRSESVIYPVSLPAFNALSVIFQPVSSFASENWQKYQDSFSNSPSMMRLIYKIGGILLSQGDVSTSSRSVLQRIQTKSIKGEYEMGLFVLSVASGALLAHRRIISACCEGLSKWLILAVQIVLRELPLGINSCIFMWSLSVR